MAGNAPAGDRTELLLKAWSLERRAETAQVRELLTGLPREQVISDPELAILLLNSLVFTFHREAAWNLIGDLRQHIYSRSNDRLQRRFINFEGILHLRENALTKAEAIFRHLEEQSRQANDDYTLAFASANLGHVALLRYECADALLHYSRALILAGAQQGSRGVARILWGTARAYSDLEMYPEAERDFAAAKRHGLNQHERAFMEVSESLMLAESGRGEAASQLASRARAFFHQVHESIGIAFASFALARVAAYAGDVDVAHSELQRARSASPNSDIVLDAGIEEEAALVAMLSGEEELMTRAVTRATELYYSAETPRRVDYMHRRLVTLREQRMTRSPSRRDRR